MKDDPKKLDVHAVERMNKALKAALETPPRKHTDEPKRGKAKAGKKSSGA